MNDCISKSSLEISGHCAESRETNVSEKRRGCSGDSSKIAISVRVKARGKKFLEHFFELSTQ